MGIKSFRVRVAVRVERYVAEARAKVQAGEARFLGLERAKKLSVWHASDRPSARTAGRDAKARKRVAAERKGRLGAMLDALIEFRDQHRAAWLRMRSGLDALFPPGTWAAWRYYGAKRMNPSDPTLLIAGPPAAPS